MTKQADVGVYQNKNGTWAYRFKVVINGEPVFKKSSKDEDGNPFTSKKAAVAARKRAIEEEKRSELLEASRNANTYSEIIAVKTVAEVYAEYCQKGRSDRAFQTIRKQDSLWNNHLRDKFGNRRVDEITTAEVQDFLSMLYYEDGYAYQYTEAFLKMFYLIFGQAYSRGYLQTVIYNRLCVNKDTKIHMPKMKVDEDTDIKIFSEDELSVLDEYFTGTNAETAYLLGRFCGLRINETYGLKWEQVDFDAGTIRIEQQMQYQQGLIKLVPLKTRNARRTVFLHPKVKAYLYALHQEQQRQTPYQAQLYEQNQTMITDVDGTRISSLLLVNSLPNGKIQTVNSMKYHSRMIQERFGFTFKYHYLRHTYGTHLAMMNTPTHILCNQMGHGKIETTKKYYITVSKQGIDVLMENLNRM